MAQPQKPPREKNLLDDPKLKLSAPALAGSKDRPSLQPGYANNNPYLMVRTGVPNDKDYGKIRAGMDSLALYRLFEMIERACNATGPTTEIMENKNRPWNNAEKSRSKDLLVETRTYVGRDKEGRIFISVTSYDSTRPKVLFHFGQQYYHILRGKDGVDLSDSVVSVDTARAWVKLLRDCFGPVANANYVHRTMDQGGGGGGGNRYGGGGGNNGGGYQRPEAADEMGDALPF